MSEISVPLETFGCPQFRDYIRDMCGLFIATAPVNRDGFPGD